jgi:transcriptional regulator with XRE-family HTH domain
MLVLMDAFAEAVEAARQRLARDENRTISNRELARRAGIAESTLAYNLSDKRHAEGRRISADIVRKLAAVLPISEGDLMRAAQVAAGYQVVEEGLPDFDQTVVRYLSQPLSRAERMRALARLQEILAEEMRRAAEVRNGNGD